MHYTSVKDFEAANGLTVAETQLVAAVRAGKSCILNEGEVPDASDPAHTIRADLLALLITGGSKGCGLSPFGVELFGAFVSDQLRLNHAQAVGDTALVHCRFAIIPELRLAHFQSLIFDASHLPGLSAQSVEVATDLFLRGVTATGLMCINGSKIGGQVSFNGAKLSNAGGMAVEAQSMTAQALIWQSVKSCNGRVDLTAAHVGDLVDNTSNWPAAVDMLSLDSFTYDRVIKGSIRAKDRLPWLKLGSTINGTFTPQPYTQLAKVLREMGHDREARLVLIEREKLLAEHLFSSQKSEYLNALTSSNGDAGMIWLSMRRTQLWTTAMRRITGYGYAPYYALNWALVCIVISTIVYFIGYMNGWMVPNSAVVLTSQDWTTAFNKDSIAPALEWKGQAAAHYETFYPLPYALDVFLPVVDLGQHAAWTQTTTTNWGLGLRIFTWLLQGAGYLITGLGLAAITGLIQKDRG